MRKLSVILFVVSLMPLLTESHAFPPGYADKVVPKKHTSKFVQRGSVMETITKGNYTYAKVKNKNKELWLATSKSKLHEGDQVEFLKGKVMKDFHSKGLDKTFKEIYFTSYVKVLSPASTISSIQAGAIEKSDYSVSDIFKKHKELQNKIVKIRAKVVKFSPNIMQKNWVHIQDGTKHQKQYDLVVTTSSLVKPGDTVLVIAKVSLDRDFGHGYKYPILLEEGEIKVEK